MVTALAFVACAAVAAVARLALSAPLNAPSTFPWGTLLVNVTGSAALGLLAGSGPAVVTVLGTGAIGAYTTFSTFAVETDVLARRAPITSAAYVAASVVLCTGAAWIGLVAST
jgi:CrcB protein